MQDTQLRKRKILILSANPRGTIKLRLDQEMREIKEGLRRAKKRDQYSIDIAEAVRYRDIHRAILDYEPHIIHFCGHGAGEEGLMFEDEAGQVKLVDAQALAGLFDLFADQIECVVLNACYSKVQAEEIARHINYVVGMSKEIGDRAAIEFAVGFYDALGAGRSVEFAYKLGCNAIRIAGIAEHLIPVFINKTTTDQPVLSSPKTIDKENTMSAIQGEFNQKKIERLQRDLALAQKQSNELTELINVIVDESNENIGDFVRQRNLKKRKERYEEERSQYDQKVERLQAEINKLNYG
jgi:hypothetical protein